VDAVDVTLGVPPQRALLDSQLGKTDLAELSEDTARRAQQSNVKLWKSLPLTLYAVKFPAPPKSGNDRKLREALSLSVDRNAMARVLLQKQAEASVVLLAAVALGICFSLRYGKQSGRREGIASKPDGKFAGGCSATSLDDRWQQ